MYGLIHICLQDMVITKYGEEEWKKILVDAGYGNKSYLTFRSYPDEETLKLIESSAHILCITLNEALEMLGDYFLEYVMKNGYAEMLQSLGSTFLDFIENVNYLHWYLMSTAYPGIVSPSFVCSPGLEEGDPPILDYYSNRMGMHPLGIGLLRAIGRDLFHMDVEFEFLESHEEILTPTRTLYHRKFRVISKSILQNTELSASEEKEKLAEPKQKPKSLTLKGRHLTKGRMPLEKISPTSLSHMKTPPWCKPTSKEQAIHCLSKVSISGIRQGEQKEYGGSIDDGNSGSSNRMIEERFNDSGGKERNFAVSVPSTLFCKMQPYHIVFDSNTLTVVQAGSRLTQFYPQLLSSPRMDAVFELVWPLVPLTPYNLKRFKDLVFQLAAKQEDPDEELILVKKTTGNKRSTRSRTITEYPQVIDGYAVGRRTKEHLGKIRETDEFEKVRGQDRAWANPEQINRRGKRSISTGRMLQKITSAAPVVLPRGHKVPVGTEDKEGSFKGRKGLVRLKAGGEEGVRRDGDSKGRRERTWIRGEGSESEGKEIVKVTAKEGAVETVSRASRKGQLGEKVLILKGGIYPMEEESSDDKESDLMIFVGTPLLSNLSELIEKSMRLSDVPMYDSTRELVLLKHQRSTEFDLMTRLEETTMELKTTWEALRVEKQKADSLLYSMMPREVAVLLQKGERVQKSFSECTILFSDIVTFTVIASNSTPLQIINMLNALYTEFDALTEKNDVYKVETIGDAYMVVGGVPSPSPNHAVQVANQAVGMVQVSGKVLSPVSGLPIEIRVGLHSGPVVAGCVGLKMPRYCLFGDTVNTASRMESHGVPGKIHISGATKRALDGSDFKMTKRGDIEVKGKGVMDTYFLEMPSEQI